MKNLSETYSNYTILINISFLPAFLAPSCSDWIFQEKKRQEEEEEKIVKLNKFRQNIIIYQTSSCQGQNRIKVVSASDNSR